ncbi:hypothetical protein BY996DRAFT_6491985 [Phakopsora pachyrhizi]|uniref:Uncharacterized protein n=1 Tax=Phakopsora pachyrhizi TaxID=170000 RepID=A0AAV0BHG2_PHAPC|nr:hypothetical protein BY996DRAFT_6491985 [Phakopsora pachyrhizi]CAH7686341.1 hypothetical protein PPACK8108_LOCUS20979 [Phakopsora pachyrhizi]
MFLYLYLDKARLGSCLEDCRRARLEMDRFKIELDESCLTGLTTQRTELVCSLRMIQRGLRMEGLEGWQLTFNSSNRITHTARPDLGTATIQ